MEDAEVRTEDYRDGEHFTVVPIKPTPALSKHIEPGTSPIEYLLLTEDKDGKIRRSNIVLFYPDNTTLTKLPANSFHDFFLNEAIGVDGRFVLISLGDVKHYEMKMRDSKPSLFKLWQSRAPAYQGDQICIDWYLITTIYYTDGHTEIYEEYLYTACYGNGGGGGGSNTGNNGNTSTAPPELVQRQVEMLVDNRYSSTERWEMHADYYLNGMFYPDDPSKNYFTSAPISVDPSGQSTAHMLWQEPLHTWPPYTYYIEFHLTFNQVGLSGDKNAWTQFGATLHYPNYQNLTTYHTKSRNWQASVELH